MSGAVEGAVLDQCLLGEDGFLRQSGNVPDGAFRVGAFA